MAQPYLHRHLTCVAAPATWLSRSSGQLIDGADGLYVNDRRVLSRLIVTVDGAWAEPLSARTTGASAAAFFGVLRELGDPGPDPTVTLRRQRRVEPTGGTETLTLANRARAAITVTVAVEVDTDFAAMGAVKDGRAAGVAVAARSGGWRAADGATAQLVADPAPDSSADGRLTWRVTVEPRSSWTATVRITRTDVTGTAVVRGSSALSVTADDRRLDELVRQSVADLDALRMRSADDDAYYAAGSPWYLTLFGRDSLWTARLALPLGWATALGTVRALARRQGRRDDPHTEEAPGKILHEVRPPDAATVLPPVYYGSVDATALFVSTVADAYRWGAPAEAIAPLLSSVEQAMAWLTAHEEFVTYRSSGHGLANQAWKDSFDGVQYADGRIAVAPLSLSEVQGYAYQAAQDGAWLVEALRAGRGATPLDEAASRWRAWSDGLRQRFHSRYWCTATNPRYPAIALDADGERVDGPASNMGHLLGTGLLDADGAAAVTAWLTAPELASPYGLRTLATSAAGYNPISYHAGSVWPHDTVIAVQGLVREGQPAAAARHITALLAAAYRFDFRLPELFGGDDAPTPYPPSCRPQAWAAAVGPAIVTALLGLRVDAPAGRLVLDPIAPSPVGAFRVRGLRIGDGELAVDVDANGRATVRESPMPGVEVGVLK